MLVLIEKIEYLKKYLEIKKDNYGDEMKDELLFCFFENNYSINFLNNLKTKVDIENKVEFLVSKMILHENEDGLTNIILNYI